MGMCSCPDGRCDHIIPCAANVILVVYSGGGADLLRCMVYALLLKEGERRTEHESIRIQTAKMHCKTDNKIQRRIDGADPA